MEKFENQLMQEMNVAESLETIGGLSIIRIDGAMDGIKGNTEIFLFGIRIYHGKNVD